jgi:hypothetical protein
MGGSPPPPPPPARQPREGAKEESMYHRNLAFSYAIQAAGDSYTSAMIVKTLADILLPETESQLRREINDHYTIVTEYRRAQIIYSTTVQTFLDVDSLVKASIDKLNTIRGVGETYLDDFDQSVIKYITEGITTVYKNQSAIQEKFIQANSNLELIKTLYETASPLTADEKEPIYKKHADEIQRLCDESRAIYTSVETIINDMKTRIDNDSSLKFADTSRSSIKTTSANSRENLQSVAGQINAIYTKNVQDYSKELERRRKWYDYYRRQADLVRERQKIVIDPAVFRRLMNWAHNAHLNAVYAALYAVSANDHAFRDRNVVYGT